MVLGGADRAALQKVSAIAADKQMRDGYGIPYEQGQRLTQPNGQTGTTATSALALLGENNPAAMGQVVDASGDEGGDEGLWGWIHRGLKGAVRNTLVVAESGWQATEAFLKGLTDEMGQLAVGRAPRSDLSLGDVFRNTQAYEVYRQQRDESRVDMGSGWFAQGTVRENQSQRQKELLGTVTLPSGEEKIWNAGLGFARALSQSKLLPYNDQYWNVASGAYSAVGAIAFDPTNLLGIGIAQKGASTVGNLANLSSRTGAQVNKAIEIAREAEKSGDIVTALRYNQEALQALGIDDVPTWSLERVKSAIGGMDEQRIAVEAFLRDEAGFVSAGGARTLLVPEFAKFLTKDQSIRSLDYMAGIKDRATIWRLHKGKIGPTVAKAIAEADDVEGVIRAYAYALANPGDAMMYLGYLPQMGFVNLPEKGMMLRNTLAPYSRWFNYMPDSSILEVQDAPSYLTRVYDLYTNLPTGVKTRVNQAGRTRMKGMERYDIERRDELLNKAIDAFAAGDVTAIKNLNSQVAFDFENMFIRLGWTPDEAKSLTLWASDRDRLAQFSLTDLNNPINVDSAPLMVSQLLQSGAAVIDPTKLKQVLRGSGRVAQFRRLGGKYNELSGKQSNLLIEIDELERTLKLNNLTKEQRTRWSQELNEAKSKETRIRAQIDEISLSGDPIEKGFLNAAVLRGDDFMSKWWKPITLVRAAYILRIVPEEIARVTVGGVFGTGPGAFMDFILASIGDINDFGGQGRYASDVLGTQFSRQARDNSELAFRRADLRDEINTAQLAPNPDNSLIARLTDELAEVTAKLDASNLQSMQTFDRAMLSHRNSAALQTVTRDVQGASMTDRRLLANMSGNRALATKSVVEQRDNWVAGLADYYVQATQDGQISKVARVAAGRGINKNDKFVARGVFSSWDEHVAAGRIVDEREGLVYWLQSGSGSADLNQLIKSYAGEGRILDPNNFDDVAYVLDRQVEHLAIMVGGRRAESAFSPSTLSPDTPVPSLYKLIDGGEQDLLDAIATGKFAGTDLRRISKGGDNIEVNSEFVERLRLFGDSEFAPERVLYNRNQINGEDRFSLLRDRIVTPFFSKMYGIPSDKLARSPAFRRFYWMQMQQLARSATDEAAFRLVENAQRAGLPKKLLDDIISASKARTTVPGGGVELSVLDEVAKGAALGRVKDLLYDASRRGSALDQFRLITPFGDAWKEVWQFWGKEIVSQRGLPVKRLAKGVQGLREAGVMEQDAISGDWHVQVPLSDKIARLLPGIPGLVPGKVDDFTPGPFTMPAQSLNVLGTFSPGIGPVVNTAVNSWIPDDARWDKVRDWLFPVAEPAQPGTEAARNNLYQQLLFPSPWIRRVVAGTPDVGPLAVLRNFVNDIENDPAFQATRNHVVQSLASSRPSTETRGADNMKKLFDDADQIAKRMYFLRGVFAFMGPGTPMPKYIAETGQGNMSASLLTDEWRKLEQALLERGESPGVAAQMMVDVYGPDIWLYTASNSSSTIKGAEASNAWWDWYRAGGDDIVKKYPNVGAYFGDIGDFSIDAYGSLVARGIYKRKKGDALYQEAATDIAFLAYNQLKDQMPPEAQRSPEQRRLLASVREALQQYWGVSLSGSVRIEERDRQIREFVRLIDAADNNDPVANNVMQSESGEMLRQYMAQRQVFSEQTVELLGGTSPTSFRTKRSAAPFRDALRDLGERLSTQNTTFARMYQYVLAGELFDDEDMSTVESVQPARQMRTPQARPGESLPSGMIPGRRT
jgi:hypothetical protein